MSTQLSETAPEEGTFPITVAFYNEAGVAMTPNDGTTWTLTDSDGNVINSRSAVAIIEATTVTIVLFGDDLAIGTNGRRRVLTVQGTYNSSTLGNNLPFAFQCSFIIENLLLVS